MRILVDVKNIALYGGGIAHWISPLLAAWIKHRPDDKFLLLGPDFNTEFLPKSDNWAHVRLNWPKWLPRQLQHPWYDNVLYPRAVARLKPDMVMSPYHDVRMPKGIPSIISVHDLCLDEMDEVYPRRIRMYYLSLLRWNLKRASLILTVSETSRRKLIERYGVAPDRVRVVYNASPAVFDEAPEAKTVGEFKYRYAADCRLLFYAGGSEYRKNIERLVLAFRDLLQKDSRLILLATGKRDARWDVTLAQMPNDTRQKVVFAGRLNDQDLCLAYAAADAVIYPSLCEGFGRVCIEAMSVGTPLACSDLPVMREVAGNYAHYFDPYDIDSMARSVSASLSEGKRLPVRDLRFQNAAVRASFLCAMDRFVGKDMHIR